MLYKWERGVKDECRVSGPIRWAFTALGNTTWVVKAFMLNT